MKKRARDRVRDRRIRAANSNDWAEERVIWTPTIRSAKEAKQLATTLRKTVRNLDAMHDQVAALYAALTKWRSRRAKS